MEAASVPVPKAPVIPEGSGAGEKGLKAGAIGFISGIVIGVASTAPGYSLAASLGLVVGIVGIGVHAPVIMIAAFIPMLLVASAYYWMNRADPDCGTTFSWVTRAMGPSWGWIGGWAIIVADVIVMANLAQIAGLYTFLLFGVDDASTLAVTILGVIFIAAMTWICVVGIELEREDADRAARRRAAHARPVLGGRAGARVRQRRSRRIREALGRMVQPRRHRIDAVPSSRGSCSRSSSTGAGTRPSP